MKKILFLSAILILGFAACSENDPPVSVTGVTLSPTTLALTVGSTETLTATVQPHDADNQNVTWSSSNSNVATVANGAVTAVSPGTAAITATTADGSRKATCAVTVSVRATSVTLNRVLIELLVGDTETLIATVLPENAANQNVTWSSNHPAIATVDANGVVTAESIGTAVITVTTAGGNFTAACEVVVFDTDTHDKGVEINGIRWATRNVAAPGTFADTPEDVGMFFQWNRRQSWATEGAVTGWDRTVPEGTTWERANDPCPAGWRVPTQAEMTNLFNYATNNGANHTAPWRTAEQSDFNIDGWVIENEDACVLFLPAAGLRSTSANTVGLGHWGFYWSSSASETRFGWTLGFTEMSGDVSAAFRVEAFSVRCVAEK